MCAAEMRVKLREGVVAWRQIDEETILLDLAASEYVAINGSGSLLWPAMVDGTTERELVERLMGSYQLTEARAVTDVDAFLKNCRARGFLEP
jgi:Coenzyme PQQ synthesis protein D (PqqD)